MIAFIVAYAHGGVMGKDGQLPWHLPNDLKHVKAITTGHTLVMGRKTYESIGRPLPNRRNVVLTRDTNFHPPGVEVIHNKEDVHALGDVYIFGGENVFKQFMDEVNLLYITEIDADIPGDTFFPEWDRNQFTLISKVEGTLDEKNTLPHTFYLYERKMG